MIILKKIIPISLLIFLIDQLIKLVVTFNIKLNTSISIIKDFFYISNVHNYGAAFSILYGNRLFLIIVSFLAILFIYYFLIRNKKLRKIEEVIYSLLLGGVVGNLFDRIIHGYVIDFLDFHIFGYNFPIFNIADICIVISIGLIILDTIRSGGSADNSR